MKTSQKTNASGQKATPEKAKIRAPLARQRGVATTEYVIGALVVTGTLFVPVIPEDSFEECVEKNRMSAVCKEGSGGRVSVVQKLMTAIRETNEAQMDAVGNWGVGLSSPLSLDGLSFQTSEEDSQGNSKASSLNELVVKKVAETVAKSTGQKAGNAVTDALKDILGEEAAKELGVLVQGDTEKGVLDVVVDVALEALGNGDSDWMGTATKAGQDLAIKMATDKIIDELVKWLGGKVEKILEDALGKDLARGARALMEDTVREVLKEAMAGKPLAQLASTAKAAFLKALDKAVVEAGGVWMAQHLVPVLEKLGLSTDVANSAALAAKNALENGLKSVLNAKDADAKIKALKNSLVVALKDAAIAGLTKAAGEETKKAMKDLGLDKTQLEAISSVVEAVVGTELNAIADAMFETVKETDANGNVTSHLRLKKDATLPGVLTKAYEALPKAFKAAFTGESGKKVAAALGSFVEERLIKKEGWTRDDAKVAGTTMANALVNGFKEMVVVDKEGKTSFSLKEGVKAVLNTVKDAGVKELSDYLGKKVAAAVEKQNVHPNDAKNFGDVATKTFSAMFGESVDELVRALDENREMCAGEGGCKVFDKAMEAAKKGITTELAEAAAKNAKDKAEKDAAAEGKSKEEQTKAGKAAEAEAKKKWEERLTTAWTGVPKATGAFASNFDWSSKGLWDAINAAIDAWKEAEKEAGKKP
jgi:hypothetical protein